MLDIKRALKAKIFVYSEENIKSAEEKCLLARSYLYKSINKDNYPEDIFKALDLYLEAIDIYSKLIEPYISIAEICSQFEMQTEAVALLNKVLEIEPGNLIATAMLEEMNNGFISFPKVKKINKTSNQLIAKDNKKDFNDVCTVKFKIPSK